MITILYTRCMAVDAMSVARLLDGVVIGESLPPTTLIDSVVALSDSAMNLAGNEPALRGSDAAC